MKKRFHRGEARMTENENVHMHTTLVRKKRYFPPAGCMCVHAS